MQWFADEFPYAMEQGIISREQGISSAFRLEQGICAKSIRAGIHTNFLFCWII
jgi:hypothetical protein